MPCLGASPIYLLGKYYLGVNPTKPGYEAYTIQPQLGGLQWMQGKVPTPNGDIEVYCSTKQIKIKAATGVGTLKIKSKTKPTGKDIVVNATGVNNYEITIQPGVEYVVNFSAF